MIIVRDATAADLEPVAALMRAFVAWHRKRHARDIALIDRYFDPEDYERELRALPGPYAAPHGALLVAERDGVVVGCVALKPLGDGACEMKRLFVDPDAHGAGVGERLARAVVERARAFGYARMLLDTGPLQAEAQGLYRKLGFVATTPYYDVAPDLRDWLVFMQRDLGVGSD